MGGKLLIHAFVGFLTITVSVSSCKKERSCENCFTGNKPPTAIAGPDQTISLPVDSVLLDGSASTDTDGNIDTWSWRNISNASSFNVINSTAAKTMVNNLAVGIYLFELKVTDDGNLSSTDTVQITVIDSRQQNQPPIANAGPDQSIFLPNNTVNLDGSASTDADNNIINYAWSKISGPSSYSLSNANGVNTLLINLEAGIYEFELSVTDAGGLIDKDTVQISVNDTTSLPLVDVYVAGQLNSLPVYWKNGQNVFLSNGAVNEWASSIAVAGNDIAVSGSEYWDGNVPLRYWINNREIRLNNTLGHFGTTAIVIANSDVYVTGWEYSSGTSDIAKYWKNGLPVSLTDGTKDAYANSIVIIGKDIYVAGEEGGIAKYWKNGQPVSLSNPANQAFAKSIAVVGNDVYVAGSEWNGTQHIAKYWKNGQAVTLSKRNSDHATANSIAVVGSDVYVAGWEGDFVGRSGRTGSVAKYWKNGQEVSLTNGSTYAYANSIAVYGNDVYVAGTDYSASTSYAKYWKNGKEFLLSDKAAANSIVLVKH